MVWLSSMAKKTEQAVKHLFDACSSLSTDTEISKAMISGLTTWRQMIRSQLLITKHNKSLVNRCY